MKILLAEDDFVTRKFMASFLSKYGECDVTVDGMEAVDAFMLALEEIANEDRYKDKVDKLVCFSGIQTHTALSIVLLEITYFNPKAFT